MKKITALAEAHYVIVAPYNHMGPVAKTLYVHFAASTLNFFPAMVKKLYDVDSILLTRRRRRSPKPLSGWNDRILNFNRSARAAIPSAALVTGKEKIWIPSFDSSASPLSLPSG